MGLRSYAHGLNSKKKSTKSLSVLNRQRYLRFSRGFAHVRQIVRNFLSGTLFTKSAIDLLLIFFELNSYSNLI